MDIHMDKKGYMGADPRQSYLEKKLPNYLEAMTKRLKAN
jgi:hypothetical protein